MKILVEGYTYRTVDNFRPILDGLASRGHEIGVCFFPHLSVPQNLALGELPFRRLAWKPLSDPLGELPREDLRRVMLEAVREFEADAILLDDILNYPSNAIHAIIKSEHPNLAVIAFQHGFFQFWGTYRRNFACDQLLVYGDRDRREFFAHQQQRVTVLGLPKLSRLRGVPISDDGTLLFVGQDSPRPEIIVPALREFAALSGRRIRVRMHPQHSTYAGLAGAGFEVLSAQTDVVPHLASCHGVITTGSTAGMEALCLGKPVVSLNSYSSTIFRDSPAVTYDTTGAEIARVLAQWPTRNADLEAFLADAVSPLSFDVQASVDLVEHLALAKAR